MWDTHQTLFAVYLANLAQHPVIFFWQHGAEDSRREREGGGGAGPFPRTWWSWSFHRQRHAAGQRQSSARQGSKVRGAANTPSHSLPASDLLWYLPLARESSVPSSGGPWHRAGQRMDPGRETERSHTACKQISIHSSLHPPRLPSILLLPPSRACSGSHCL